jgi:lipopolysaccharide export system protein LptA
MRFSVERLRWVLAGGAALLLVVVAGFLAYGRYRGMKLARDLQHRLGISISHESDNVTYSQTVKGKTLYTLRAAKAIQRDDGKYTLRDAELTLYSRTSDSVDHIYGSEFEYDPQQGIARALGEVHMDLEAPQGMARPEGAPQKIRGREGRAPSAARSHGEDMQTIHVLTSGLVYIRALGIAATQEDVEFRFGGVQAHAHGADFDQAASIVHLLSDVSMHGDMHGHPVLMQAAKADLDRENNLVSVAMPVVMSEGRRAQARSATAHLRKDGSIALLNASGQVTLAEQQRTLQSAELEAVFDEKSAPQSATLSGGVTVDDNSAQRPSHGTAQRLDTVFDANGQMKVVTATGEATVQSRERSASGVWLPRSVRANTLTMKLTPGEDGRASSLSEVHAVGDARMQSVAIATPVAGVRPQPGTEARPQAGTDARPQAPIETKLISVAADDLTAHFGRPEAGDQSQLEQVVGLGHVRLQQDAARGEQQVTTADAMQMQMAAEAGGKRSPAKGDAGLAGGLTLASATEDGHVEIHTRSATQGNQAVQVSDASSQHATYRGNSQVLTLNGAATFRQNGVELAARQIAVEQATGNAQAAGSVAATLTGSVHGPSSHVMADHATLAHSSQVADFFGTDARPARLWQDASQVLAAQLTMDGERKTLTARPVTANGTITALFAGESAGKGTAPGASHLVRVVSQRMDYSDSTHDAVFAGGVTMHASQGDVHAQRVVVFLKPKGVAKPASGGSSLEAADPAGASIDHAVASGDVHFAEPGRSGTGEQLLYTAASDTFVLTGTPSREPRVVDASQGNVTGGTLVFGAADSTIVVAGDDAGGKHGRVRTETEVAHP